MVDESMDAASTLPTLTALREAALQLAPQCSLVVATAIFEGTQLLRQPRYCKSTAVQAEYRRAQRHERATARCHVAFVDWQSERLLKQVQAAELERERGESFVGCWQLLRVGAGTPYTQPAANAAAVKLLLPMLLLSSTRSLWVDAARNLHVDNVEAVEHVASEALREDTQLVGVWRARPGDEGDDGGGGGGDGDIGAAAGASCSLIIRRHVPPEASEALARSWWARWEKLASTLPPASARPESASAAAEHMCAAALATLQRGGARLANASATIVLLPTRAPISSEAAAREPLPAAPSRSVWPQATLGQRRVAVRNGGGAAGTAGGSIALRIAFADGSRGGTFGGASEDDARDAALALDPSATDALPCGFLRASSFDAVVALGLASHCEMVTLTAIFDGYDRLIQPTDEALRRADPEELKCFFAFVDQQSYDLVVHDAKSAGTQLAITTGTTGAAAADADAARLTKVGVWQLVLLDGSALPFRSSRRNSRVPKMLAHRLFPRAHYALWIDSKLRLHQPPALLRRMFLGGERGGAVFAAFRNLRRDHIDEERDWVWKHKCAQDVARCAELFGQWAEYEGEQTVPSWAQDTVAIEGSLLLQNLRAPVHNALFCNWFNEYLRHGERDQMAISYVLHRMGLTAHGANATRSVRLIEHRYHYLTKPSDRPLTLVTKLGHRSGSRRVPPR